MHCRSSWPVVMVALILITAATGFQSTQAQTDAEDRGDEVTFRVRIENVSANSGLPTQFSPGVWVNHGEVGPFFTSGAVDRGEGLENLAEDGDPSMLLKSLEVKGLKPTVFNEAVCGDGPGPLEPDHAYEFEVTASPATPYLSFVTKLVQSNDLFLAPDERGIALFDESGEPIRLINVTTRLRLWDAGTEANEAPGQGPNQPPRQPSPNTGPADPISTVRPANDEFDYPQVTDLVKVYIIPLLKVERGGGQEPTPSAHRVGEAVRVGGAQWRVLSSKTLGYELGSNGKRETTDERFVQVRFEILNLGSVPLNFRRVLLRDGQGREYENYSNWREFVPKDEECVEGFMGRGPTSIKPNDPTICSVILEVYVDATNLVFVLSDLENEDRRAPTVDLNLPPEPQHPPGIDIRVGDVRWQLLSAEDLGHILETDGNTEKTQGRFIRVTFQLTNKGSDDLRFYGTPLRDKQGREHERKLKFSPDDEECNGWRGHPLPPNDPKKCVNIFEVPGDATGLVFVARDLEGGEDGTKIISLNLPDKVLVPFNFIGEDVRVGDVCWHVLSVDELGQHISNNVGARATAQGRFLQTQFQLLNLSSETLRYEGVSLVDSESRVYRHFDELLEHVEDARECPPSGLFSGHYPLEPNTRKICTAIHDVAVDAKNLTLWASDLEGYETGLIILPNVVAPPPNACPVPPGTHEVGENIAPGVYRGEALEGSYCYWARLNSLEEEPGTAIESALREGPFYVEVLESDAAFASDCDLTRLECTQHPVPLPTTVSMGMHLVGKDIAPGRYRGNASADQFCFWQRLSCVSGGDECSTDWGLSGGEYVVDVAPSDFAVEFGCSVKKAE